MKTTAKMRFKDSSASVFCACFISFCLTTSLLSITHSTRLQPATLARFGCAIDSEKDSEKQYRDKRKCKEKTNERQHSGPSLTSKNGVKLPFFWA